MVFLCDDTHSEVRDGMDAARTVLDCHGSPGRCWPRVRRDGKGKLGGTVHRNDWCLRFPACGTRQIEVTA